MDGFNITLGNTNVIYEYFIVTFGGFLIFFFTNIEWFQHLTGVYCTNITYDHSIVKFGGFYLFIFFILKLNGFNVTLGNIITYGRSIVALGGSLFFLLTLDGLNVSLGSSNITYNRTIVKFDGSHTFYSHLIIPMSQCHIR